MRLLRRLTVGLLWLAALAVAWPAGAQTGVDQFEGQPVVAIRFEVEGQPVTSPALDDLVALRPGQPYTAAAIHDSISHLYNVGGFDDVQVFGTKTPTGVNVLFRLTPRHPIDRLEFRGNTGLGASELDRLVRERYGGLPTRQQPDEVAQVVETLLQDDGFPEAHVDASVEVTHNPDRATLVMDVQAGPQTMIAQTVVTGNSPLSAEDVIDQTDTRAGRPFRRRAVEAALATIGDTLRSQGYYSAVAVIAQPPTPAPDGRGVIVTLRVEAGPRVTLRWDGPEPPGDPEDYVPLRRQRSADEDLLEDSDQRVADYWKRQGYKDVSVSHTTARQDDELVVTMHVVRGVEYRIDTLRVTGDTQIPDDVIRETLALSSGDPYDPGLVAAGMARIRQLYLRQGYDTVQVRELESQEVPGSRTAADVRVVVRIEISEGPQARIGTVRFDGSRPEFEADLGELMVSKPGAPYVLEDLVQDKANIETFYRDRGFEDVQVGITPTLSEDKRTVAVVVQVSEGPQIIVGDIRVVGNRSVSEESVKQQMTLRVGQPYGEAARLESTRRLYNMGVFRQVNISEEPRLSGQTLAHVVVNVQESPPGTFSYGGGIQAGRRAVTTAGGATQDRLDIAPRGFIEIGRRNLGGKNRSVNFFSRIAVRPGSTTAGANYGFSEYRVAGSYRESHALKSDTDALVGVTFEQAVRTGFNFARKAVNAELSRQVSPRLNVSARYTLEYNRLFDVNPSIVPADQLTIDRLFPQVRLSSVASGVVWDRRQYQREDPVEPVAGTLASADWQLAARRLGSEVGYAKVFLQATAFHALSASPRMVLAGRAEVGLAHGFERQVISPDGQVQTVADLPASQRFFAGGGTTVRGFQLDRLGVPAIITSDGLSRGGNGIVVLNAELRTTIGRLLGHEFGVVGFTDAGNVFAKARDINLSQLRAAYGFGFRYNSPIGPVRLDFGFKVHRGLVAGQLERRWEYHLNIGEAF